VFEKITCILFRISTLVFLLGGLAIVLGQAGGLVAGNGEFVTGFEETLAPWAYGASGVAGLLAFVLMYFHPESEHDGETAHTEHNGELDGSVSRHAPEHA
jgi:hypothetical protein